MEGELDSKNDEFIISRYEIFINAICDQFEKEIKKERSCFINGRIPVVKDLLKNLILKSWNHNKFDCYETLIEICNIYRRHEKVRNLILFDKPVVSNPENSIENCPDEIREKFRIAQDNFNEISEFFKNKYKGALGE